MFTTKRRQVFTISLNLTILFFTRLRSTTKINIVLGQELEKLKTYCKENYNSTKNLILGDALQTTGKNRGGSLKNDQVWISKSNFLLTYCTGSLETSDQQNVPWRGLKIHAILGLAVPFRTQMM